MPRGKGKHGGFRPNPPPRGRGRGRGRGGLQSSSPFHGAFFAGSDIGGHDVGAGTLVFEGNFEDFNLDHVMAPRSRRGASPARSRGGYQTPPRAFQPEGGGRGAKSSRGLGFSRSHDSPRGSPRPSVALSILERNRPLLRPVIFVRGEIQKTLFEQVEEILHAPGEEDVPMEDHAPSADVVERMFNTNAPEAEASSDTSEESVFSPEAEVYEEPVISLTNVRDEPVASDDPVEAVKDEHIVPMTVDTDEIPPTFITDTAPSPIVLDSQPHQTFIDPSLSGSAPLGASIDEEDVIVYEAPHPRTGRSTPAIPPPSISSPKPTSPEPSILSPQPAVAATSIDDLSFTLPPTANRVRSRVLQAHARTRYGLKPTPRSRKIAKKERAAARRRAEREAMFHSVGLGPSMDELKTLRHDAFAKVVPRKVERRHGDSDVDWGTDTNSAVEEVRSAIGDMDLDPELPSITQFAPFARGVQGLGTGEMITIADLEDMAKMEEEDENEATENTEPDHDYAGQRAVDGENSDLVSSGTSDEETPRRGFQARLARLRQKGKGKAVADADTSEGDTNDDGVLDQDFSWADRDQNYMDHIHDILDENDDILGGRDRKARNKLFKTLQSDAFMYDGLNMRKKDRAIPSHLRDQWDGDRAKKSERKRQRALAREEAAAEYSMRKSLGKQRTLGSSRVEGDTFIANRMSDLATLEQQIRTFIHDLDLKTMVLPPKSKEWRVQAHVLAKAFNLKSKSTGKGESRFITLIKTTRSGVGVNERKIARLIKGSKGEGFQTPLRIGRLIKAQDGEEVGKMAPRIGETNIGFKLLQQMGWAKGDRIGGETGGLVDPLTAIIKTTKLGLGASR